MTPGLGQKGGDSSTRQSPEQQAGHREREREMVCVGAGEVWAEVRWPVRRGEESGTRPPAGWTNV